MSLSNIALQGPNSIKGHLVLDQKYHSHMTDNIVRLNSQDQL